MPSPIKPPEKIILALDGLDQVDALGMISKIPKLCWVKVGLELFINGGPEFILKLRDQGKNVFLDLKFHDIPSTMAKACRQATLSGADLITVHACAGRTALLASNEAVRECSQQFGLPLPKLLAVTVLTSWEQKTFATELFINQPISQRVKVLAELASGSGINGCVCSPLELKQLRKLYPDSFELVTPGIRLKGESFQDQSRVMTPGEAIKDGASKLVVGRSITTADRPSEAFDQFCREILTDCS
tara:strand:- start:4359 stop:5093 length:735 start_codon:yes stop_codon:yes gene_type:complete